MRWAKDQEAVATVRRDSCGPIRPALSTAPTFRMQPIGRPIAPTPASVQKGTDGRPTSYTVSQIAPPPLTAVR